VTCDFESESLSENHLQDVDTIFHLAGIAHDTSKNNDLYMQINYKATVKLAETAVLCGVKNFIFVSSIKAGGKASPGKCMVESDQNDYDSIYGKSKRDAEIKLLEIGFNSNMFVSIVRPSLVYGPGVKGNLESMLNAIQNGWFPPLPEVNNSRSMIHVDDLVEALQFVAGEIRANGEIYIVTDGKAHSSRELYEVMNKVLGKSIPKWRVPVFIFRILAFLNINMNSKISKLFDDEFYSSEKIQSIGFKPKRLLREMNETSF